MPESNALDIQIRRAREHFEKTFARSPELAAAAPGRVNLIGEHTDYNDGFVLPMAIERQALYLAARRDDNKVRLADTNLPDTVVEFELKPDLKPGEPSWTNYVRGPLALGLGKGLDPGGFDAVIDSTVPLGSGLSSSAALEVAAATLAEALSGDQIDPIEKALLCQQAEHEFAGVPCGIMDQFISAMGQEGAALLIDCRSHDTTAVPLTDPEVSILIVNSNVKHALTGGEYAERRAQCEQAARAMEVPALRDATMELLRDVFADEDQLAMRRARHVITENERTQQFADALEARDYPRAGQLMLESHTSLRDDFEVSCPELDTLVELAKKHVPTGEVFGSRMTGGGFGGCTVTLLRTDAVGPVSKAITRTYREATGIEPAAFASRPGPGARIIELD
ncbi:MAG: galactokinase [Phycisphaeraceae bacterium]